MSRKNLLDSSGTEYILLTRVDDKINSRTQHLTDKKAEIVTKNHYCPTLISFSTYKLIELRI